MLDGVDQISEVSEVQAVSSYLPIELAFIKTIIAEDWEGGRMAHFATTPAMLVPRVTSLRVSKLNAQFSSSATVLRRSWIWANMFCWPLSTLSRFTSVNVGCQETRLAVTRCTTWRRQHKWHVITGHQHGNRRCFYILWKSPMLHHIRENIKTHTVKK